MATLKNTLIDDTGYLQLPSGTTAQRPVSPSAGYTRWNTTEGYMEIYDGTDWKEVSTAGGSFNLEYLLVAGGGGGGHGGGGAGGYLSSSFDSVTSGSSFTVTVGGGGTRGQSGTRGATPAGSNGQNSSISSPSFSTITAIGGGGGSAAGQANAGNGGSGGGQGGDQNTATRSSGTTNQGFGGGRTDRPSYGAAGGGGGAGAIGADATTESATIGRGGDGGIGLQSSITGTSTYYAGGGGGGANLNAGGPATGGGTGGNGGGGSGGLAIDSGFRAASVINTGGGGGGAEYEGSIAGGGAGGSGVAIFAYDTGSANAAGGIVGDAGNGRKYHQFNTSGTFKVGSTSDFTIDTTNLTGWWDAADYSSRGDTTWTDKMGNYNLTKGGTPTLENNPYYTFQANGEYYNSGLTVTNGAKAMVLWIKYTGAGGGGYSLSGWQEGGAYCYLGRQDSDGKYYYYIGSSTGGAAATSPTTNVWYMLTLTNNSSGDFEFYENDGSTIIASGTGINMGNNGTSRFNIGSVNNTGGHRNHAQIGMCFYYTKYLSSSDVANLYNATKTNFV